MFCYAGTTYFFDVYVAGLTHMCGIIHFDPDIIQPFHYWRYSAAQMQHLFLVMCMWHDSFILVARPILILTWFSHGLEDDVLLHRYHIVLLICMWHDSFIFVAWFIVIWTSFIHCIIILDQDVLLRRCYIFFCWCVRGMTHSYVWHDSF